MSMGKVSGVPQVKGRGFCFTWYAIEREQAGHVLCYQAYPPRIQFRCVRKKDHRGKHHHHSFDSCTYQWRNAEGGN